MAGQPPRPRGRAELRGESTSMPGCARRGRGAIGAGRARQGSRGFTLTRLRRSLSTVLAAAWPGAGGSEDEVLLRRRSSEGAWLGGPPVCVAKQSPQAPQEVVLTASGHGPFLPNSSPPTDVTSARRTLLPQPRPTAHKPHHHGNQASQSEHCFERALHR